MPLVRENVRCVLHFALGFKKPQFIKELCESSLIPCNIMVMDNMLSVNQLIELSVVRISYGPDTYLRVMNYLEKEACRTPKYLETTEEVNFSKENKIDTKLLGTQENNFYTEKNF